MTFDEAPDDELLQRRADLEYALRLGAADGMRPSTQELATFEALEKEIARRGLSVVPAKSAFETQRPAKKAFPRPAKSGPLSKR
jgi:hypothetical protein